jgi:two-component system sensor histidine kinase UhpB
VHKALAALQRSFAEVRHLAQGMAPVQLSRGLGPALAALTTSLSMPGKLTLRYQGRDVPAMPNEVAEQLYRIAQEAVSNGIRHGAAARIDITLAGVPPGLELRVADDGGGIHAKQGAAGSGIRIMRYRADLILGHLDIGPEPATRRTESHGAPRTRRGSVDEAESPAAVDPLRRTVRGRG